MADTLVSSSVRSSLDSDQGLWGPYWSDESTGVIVFVNQNTDIGFARTTDKGATWLRAGNIRSGSAFHTACWYDKETPGNAGTLIHVAWLEADLNDARYITIDVADGSLGTERIVNAGPLDVPYAGYKLRIAITQTVSGNIIYAFSTQSEIACYKSSDNFATAGTSIADVFETGTEEDWCLFFPAATADDNDACALFWDRSANEISVKMWDDSLGTWTETSVSAGMADDAFHINMDGAVRHSDSHILLAAHLNDDNAVDSLKTWDLTVDSIAAPTVTAKTNVFTNQGESAQAAILINQQNNEVYVAHLKGGTWQSTVDVVFHKSDDGMATWGAEQAYSEAAADDVRIVHAGRTVGNAGGRFQLVFCNDDLTDIFINLTNDVEIAAGAGVVTGAAVLSGVGSLAAAGALTMVASASLAGVGDLTAAGTKGETLLGAASLSGAGSLTANAAATRAGQAVLAGVGELTAVGRRIVTGAASLDGVGDLTAIGEVAGLLEGRAVLAGVGSLTAVAERIVAGQVAMAGVGSLTAKGVLVAAGVASLSGVGDLTAIGETGVIVYTQMGRRTFDIASADYPAGTLFYFEANMETEGAGQEAYVRLYNITDASEVSGSPIVIPGPGPAWGRSGSFSLAAGVKRYRVEYGGTTGGIITPHGAALRVASS